ncbi:sensor domain-containing diguanylate cyclase [Vibrio hannami]|uniref:sensor domain-containing diguanylate cyclase n=1 Tax=Vibrio hannami TaxID=2717094 RepID=UPI002410103C|nr:sensor domain-containing diguanylate cyclase [Vibrio hannami]MDG3088437.1 sensor domain-containing diguanylate cyclase [Vibrio hannami]
MVKHSRMNKDQFLLDSPNDLISLDKWQQTVNLLAELFSAPAGFLVQYTPEGFQTTICSQQETNPYPSGIIIKPDVNIFCRKIVESRQELYVNNAKVDPSWDTNPEVHNDGFNSYLGVPVFWPSGDPFGTFCVMDYEVTDYSETYIKLIHQLKDILESDLALLDLYSEVQVLAVTDPLTGISNRRGFETLAEQRLRLAKRMSQSLGLFYIDVDKFKTINDQYGHHEGDKVLISVAQSLKGHVRDSDVVGRMGGDEFVVLMLLNDSGDLSTMEAELTKAVNGHHPENQPEFSVTIGGTTYDGELHIEQLIDKADKEMLKRKSR